MLHTNQFTSRYVMGTRRIAIMPNKYRVFVQIENDRNSNLRMPAKGKSDSTSEGNSSRLGTLEVAPDLG